MRPEDDVGCSWGDKDRTCRSPPRRPAPRAKPASEAMLLREADLQQWLGTRRRKEEAREGEPKVPGAETQITSSAPNAPTAAMMATASASAGAGASASTGAGAVAGANANAGAIARADSNASGQLQASQQAGAVGFAKRERRVESGGTFSAIVSYIVR